MADQIKNCELGEVLPRLYKDMGDGTFAEVVAFTADSPVELTGDVVVDTLGALDDDPITNEGIASATIPSLIRGLLSVAKVGESDTMGGVNSPTISDSEAEEANVIGLLRGILAQLTIIATNTA